ncbi:MAG: tRNA-dihydrouridine synthase, partial [Pseudoxanthomonas sp.]|nr:tRNA-dihydrouridine synthase [Pseudoxanthomonas sp.]
NREIPPLRYDWAYRLKRERPELTVAINGGITTTAQVHEHLQHGDGVMIGRAAYHEPYVLHEMQASLFGGEPAPRADLLRAWRPYVETQLAKGVALKHLTRHVLGLFHAQPGGRAFRQVLSEGAHKPGADWSLVEQALAATQRELRPAA